MEELQEGGESSEIVYRIVWVHTDVVLPSDQTRGVSRCALLWLCPSQQDMVLGNQGNMPTISRPPPFVMQGSALKPWTSQPTEPKLLPQVHPPEHNPCHSGQRMAVDSGGTCRVGFYSTGAQVAHPQGGMAPVMERRGESKLQAEV